MYAVAVACGPCKGRGRVIGAMTSFKVKHGSSPRGSRSCHACGGTGVQNIKIIRVREEVATFAKHMEAKLQANEHKGGWSECGADYLFERLRQEANELQSEVLAGGQGDAVWAEAADVGNMAMMIADNSRETRAAYLGIAAAQLRESDQRGVL